jgi:hypothetical protein
MAGVSGQLRKALALFISGFRVHAKPRVPEWPKLVWSGRLGLEMAEHDMLGFFVHFGLERELVL